MAQISYTARNFVQQRLLDSTSGFNFWINDRAQSYPGVDSFQLVQGTSLYCGAFSADLILQSGSPTFPFCTVYSQRANNQNIVTPCEFGGLLVTVVDFWTGFPDEAPPADAESLADAIEDAMYETFNRVDYYELMGNGLTYNNEMDSIRGPITFGGENWMQMVRFMLTHRYFTAGS